jgi:vacuolar-type H+-ATPase subunit B/Vma2
MWDMFDLRQGMQSLRNVRTDHANNNNNKYKLYFMGKITLQVAQIVNTEQLQNCTLETWLFQV